MTEEYLKKICLDIEVELNRDMFLYEPLKIETLYKRLGNPLPKTFVRWYVAMDKAYCLKNSTKTEIDLLSALDTAIDRIAELERKLEEKNK